MEDKQKKYLFLILIHVVIGFVIYLAPFLSKIYGYLIILGGVYIVIKKRNKNNEVLYAAAYMVGSEVFLRMTEGSPSYEFAKYGIMTFAFLGMFYSGFSKNAVPYWIFLFLLIPSIIIATEVLSTETNIRKSIAFNISGPVSLAVMSLYTYNKKITLWEINSLLLNIGLPIISCTVYLIFYSPSIKGLLTSTTSTGQFSGGFGPNQVATVMGLGMFIFFSRIILLSRTKFILSINLFIASYISYRGMITFSRGGMMTGFAMIITLLLYIYYHSKYKGKVKLNYLMITLFVVMSVTWFYTSYQTDGLIDKRYANKDALGRIKKDKFTGRANLAEGEFNMFLENPIFGVGVSKGTEIRSEQMESTSRFASHDEITRMLAEHGSLGVLGLMILIFTPLILYINNKQHLYLFPFLVFWFLSINHAGMRTAAPSFIYALVLLKVKLTTNETPALHRK
ncbi:MAG: O-antigen ligase family protein [Bacteroidota bacterium]